MGRRRWRNSTGRTSRSWMLWWSGRRRSWAGCRQTLRSCRSRTGASRLLWTTVISKHWHTLLLILNTDNQSPYYKSNLTNQLLYCTPHFIISFHGWQRVQRRLSIWKVTYLLCGTLVYWICNDAMKLRLKSWLPTLIWGCLHLQWVTSIGIVTILIHSLLLQG